MLGIKFSSHDEERLSRFAREAKQPKSALARHWILERLDREEIDGRIYDAAAMDSEGRARLVERSWNDAHSAWLRALDAEDGGYDWGPDGPPPAR